jgi:hypothetical protein
MNIAIAGAITMMLKKENIEYRTRNFEFRSVEALRFFILYNS